MVYLLYTWNEWMYIYRERGTSYSGAQCLNAYHPQNISPKCSKTVSLFLWFNPLGILSFVYVCCICAWCKFCYIISVLFFGDYNEEVLFFGPLPWIYSLNWQHQYCKNNITNPNIKTLFVDHSCGQPNSGRAPSPGNNALLASISRAGGLAALNGVSRFIWPGVHSCFTLRHLSLMKFYACVRSLCNKHPHKFQLPLLVGCQLQSLWPILQDLLDSVLQQIQVISIF